MAVETIQIDPAAYAAIQAGVDADLAAREQIATKVKELVYSYKTVMYSCQGSLPECKAMPATASMYEMIAHLHEVHGLGEDESDYGLEEALNNLGDSADWDS